MSKVKKLEMLKNKIINKLITVKSLEKTKNEEMLKGGFFKQLFKYVFFKPLHNNKINSKEDLFLTAEGGNIPKFLIFIFIGFYSIIGGVFSLSILSIMPVLIGFFVGLGSFLICSLFMSVNWVYQNNKTNKHFNVKNIDKIKQNLLENHSDYQIKKLLKEKLDKEELTNIMKNLDDLIGKDEIINCFEKMRQDNNYEEIFNDISEPYVLIKLIEKFILEEKGKGSEKEEIIKEKEIRKFNNKLVNSLVDDNIKNNKSEIVSYNVKDLILGFERLKESEIRKLAEIRKA